MEGVTEAETETATAAAAAGPAQVLLLTRTFSGLPRYGSVIGLSTDTHKTKQTLSYM